MRHGNIYAKHPRENGKKSQIRQENKRLAAALEYGPIRPLTGITIFELWTYNPRKEAWNHLEIRHDIDNGNNRYSVYLNGDKWLKPWSRWGFCRWLFYKIDSVVL